MARKTAINVRDCVREQVAALTRSEFWQFELDRHKASEGDLVVVNNSYFHRGKASTTKSSKYLGVRIVKEGVAERDPVIVLNPGQLRGDTKKLSEKQLDGKVELSDLRQEIAEERANLGSIIFALVSEIQQDEAVEIEIGGRGSIRAIGYDPRQEGSAEVVGDRLVVNSLDDIDAIWVEASKSLVASGVDPESLSLAFKREHVKLRNMSYAPISLRTFSDISGDTILSNVVRQLEKQRASYGSYLERYLDNPLNDEIRHEILRVAYNFADGAVVFAGLVQGLSDLKPILLWMTIADQVALYTEVSSMPTYMGDGSKVSFESYRKTISDARNQAFHDIFSLGKTFRVRLDGRALSGAEMLLFRSYGDRNSPSLNFNDRKVVELLEGFTRTSEHSVPIGFWEKNVRVMDSVVTLAKSFSYALVQLGL
ncbi:hypothetical protein [Labedaea rhizosphaerae]|uniref:Uncharacterized protein n=1 Tax=Labedaea rhizosphaerae TaxID=598644 RepID=A0A4R6SDC3_LABRH|nr:hypothetical protein [Labedaea rhizosphaerae]TDP97940.1 hypothetical protein EV186_103920 [Labedaea rhizosphaerae]